MKNRRGMYILFSMSFIIASIVIWFVYKSDMPSTVTVQNGTTEVYNGVSIGDVVMALVSIAITALLGMVTYIQTQVSIEQDIWDKTPFFALQFDTYDTLSEYCNRYADIIKINKEYEEELKSNSGDEESIDDALNFIGANLSIIEEVKMLSRNMHPHLRYIKGEIVQEVKHVCNLSITNIHEVKFFSVDVFNIKWDKKKLIREYHSYFDSYVDDKQNEYAQWFGDGEDTTRMKILGNLAEKNLMPNCLLNETKIPLIFDEDECEIMYSNIMWEDNTLKETCIPPTIDKYIGLDIKMTNGYKYCQIFKLSLKFLDSSNDCALFAVMSYDTEIVSGVASEFEIKKAIKRLDAKQMDRKNNHKK